MTLDNTSAGERLRVRHALDRVEAIVHAMRIALTDETNPIGLDTTQALTQTAIDIATHAAAADAYLRAGRP